MAGHSKWNNIKRKKEKTDAQKAKVFTKIGREIAVSVRENGADPEQNSRLKDLIAKARSLNVPNDNIERLISKAAGDRDGSNYEAIVYEGYGPSGIAVVVAALTDNRNRTAGDLRHYFDKYGGNLGQTGSVMFLFQPKGVLVFENKGYSEEKLMEDCIDSGADDFEISDEAVIIKTEPNQLGSVKTALEERGYHLESAEVEYLPDALNPLPPEAKEKMEKLLEMLEDNDDVQNVWHNWDEE